MLKRQEDRFFSSLDDPNERQVLLSKLRKGLRYSLAYSCLITVFMCITIVFQLKTGNKEDFGIWPLFIFFLFSMIIVLGLEFRIYLIRVVELLTSRDSETTSE